MMRSEVAFALVKERLIRPFLSEPEAYEYYGAPAPY